MLKFRKPALLLAAFMALAIGLTGCVAQQPTTTQPAQSTPAPAQAPKPPIKIAVVTSRSGAFELWGTHNLRGFEIGLDYATNGTREINGRKIELKVYDDQGKPEVGKAMAEEAITQWKADIIQGTVSSGIALQIIPVIDQYKKIFMVEPAAADQITGANFSRYLFRTGSNVSQDALSGAVAAAKLGKKVLQLAPDYAWGHDSAKAWETIMKEHGAGVTNMFIPQETTDFTPHLQRLLAQTPEVVVFHWAGNNSTKLYQQAFEQGVHTKAKLTGGIADFASMKASGKGSAGLSGMIKYYWALPKNPVNDHLVKVHREKYNEYPDLFTGGGMASAIAIVEGLKKTGGDPDAEKMITALEGMKFNGPKGEYEFRKEDHQALQPMYVVQLVVQDPFPDFATPKLITELSAKETAPPLPKR